MLKTRISAVCAAVFALTLVATSPASAVVTHPVDPGDLGVTVSPGYNDSFFSDELVNYSDASVLNYAATIFGTGLVQIGTSAASVCGGGNVACGGGTATFSGLFANVFVVQYSTSNVLAFLYNTQDDFFSASGLGLTIGFVRAYAVATPAETPLPGAAWLFGTALAGVGVFGAWRRRRALQVA